jgi:hypothetical protein
MKPLAHSALKFLKTNIPCGAIAASFMPVRSRKCAYICCRFLHRKTTCEARLLCSYLCFMSKQTIYAVYVGERAIILLADAEGMDLGRVVYRKLGDRFQCQICDCSYARLLNLSRHIIAKHTQNSEGMFTCYVCQRWFKTKWSLATHNSRFHPRGSVMESTQSPALQQHPQEPICSDSIEDSKEHNSKMIFPGDH